MWQLGSFPLAATCGAAELVIGNLNEMVYLIATDEELLGVAPPAPPEVDAAKANAVVAGKPLRWARRLGELKTEPAADASLSPVK